MKIGIAIIGVAGGGLEPPTYQRRETGQGEDQASLTHMGNTAADADYFGNLKRFERHEDMAAEPTRGGRRSR